MVATRIDHDAVHAEEHGVRRSPRWPAVERAFLKASPWCEGCGRAKVLPRGVQVHHRFPFHFAILLGRPDLELDPRNLCGLCETEKGLVMPDHHILIGHAGDFKSYNPHVLEDAQGRFHGKTEAEIRACPVWQAMVANRPKLWQDMTDEDKRAMRAAMDRLLPRLQAA